jgi:hypothetical protein
MIQAFVACIMLALPLADVSAQNILGRGVLSSGGIGMSTSSGMRMNGSVSQSAIGITRSAQSVGETLLAMLASISMEAQPQPVKAAATNIADLIK